MKTNPASSRFSLLLFLPVILSCGLAGRLQRAAKESQKPTTITSADATSQLTLPGGWSEDKELNQMAVLQGSDRFREMYVVVIRQDKSDFGEAVTLDGYAELTRTSLSMGVSDPHFTDTIPAYGIAYPSREYELEALVEKVKIKYLCTIIESPEHFYQVLTWTLPSRFRQNESALRSVTQSFKILGEPEASATP